MIAITGAAGFIGSALAWELNQRGHSDLLLVDWLENGLKWKNIAHRRFKNIVDPDDFLGLLQTSQSSNITTIFHMGACSSTTETNVDYLLENNYQYSKSLFEWATQNKARFIYASSGATYGDGSKGFSDTTDPFELMPLNPYGYSKVLFDRFVKDQKNLPLQCVGLKFFNVFGPNEYHKEDMTSMAYKAFHQIQAKGKVRLFKSHNADYKDGEQLRDFVYVKDITRWMAELLERPEISGIFNMGFGKARTWKDLVGAAFEALDKPIEIEWIDIPENIRSQYQYFTEADMKTWKSLNLSEPKWNLEEAMKDYIRILLKQNPYL